MKKTIFALLMMTVAIGMNAMTPAEKYINGVSLVTSEDGTVVPSSMNEDFLKGVYCGSLSDLKKEQIIITDMMDAGAYTCALMNVGDNVYCVTYKPKGGIIDGLLLLCKNDILLGYYIKYPENKFEAKTPVFILEENKITVKRKYSTIFNGYKIDVDAISKKGGLYTIEDGTFTLKYVVDETGKISEGDKERESVETRVNYARACGGDGHMERMEKNTYGGSCSTLGPGILLFYCYATPVSKEDPNELEMIFEMNQDFNDRLFNHAVQRENQASPVDWLERMVYRNPQLWLSWLNEHPESLCISHIKQAIDFNDEFKLWLKGEVKKLKNKKVRKAWEALLKQS
jgi:hypothetical protein